MDFAETLEAMKAAEVLDPQAMVSIAEVIKLIEAFKLVFDSHRCQLSELERSIHDEYGDERGDGR